MGSCNKKNDYSDTIDVKHSSAVYKLTNTTPDNLEVSEYGFLILKSSNIEDYLGFLKNSDKGSINAFHNSIKYVAQSPNDNSNQNSLPPNDQNIECLFNADGVVQVDDMIIKGVYEQGYFPCPFKSTNLTSKTYQGLRSGSFDPAVMYKLKIQGLDSAVSLEQFINAKSEGSYTNVNPPVPASFILFGHRKKDIYVMGEYNYTVHKFYLFGVVVKTWITP